MSLELSNPCSALRELQMLCFAELSEIGTECGDAVIALPICRRHPFGRDALDCGDPFIALVERRRDLLVAVLQCSSDLLVTVPQRASDPLVAVTLDRGDFLGAALLCAVRLTSVLRL